MNLRILSATVLLLLACKGDSNQETADKGAETSSADPSVKKATDKPESKMANDGIPDTTEAIALNSDGNAIPATIEMPTGSTIFADSPTMLRVGLDGKDDLGRRKSLFAVQVHKGNEFNLNLEEFAGELAKNQYGTTHEVLEKTDTLLFYKSTVDEGGYVSHSFQQIIELGGEKWLCKQGNDGGWSEEQARAQLKACLTLKSI